jgi:hypothetical protein
MILLHCRGCDEQITTTLDTGFWSEPDNLYEWLAKRMAGRTHPFERGIVELELKQVKDFCNKWREDRTRQLSLL